MSRRSTTSLSSWTTCALPWSRPRRSVVVPSIRSRHQMKEEGNEMFRLIFRTWHYSVAFLSQLFDEGADPRVQIEQAIEEAKRQHGMLAEQAAAVIGNQRELQLKIARGNAEIQRLDASAAQALRLADAARSRGDQQSATSFERTAQLLATQLAGAQSSVADLG